jgi:hypothetical protein
MTASGVGSPFLASTISGFQASGLTGFRVPRIGFSGAAGAHSHSKIEAQPVCVRVSFVVPYYQPDREQHQSTDCGNTITV